MKQYKNRLQGTGSVFRFTLQQFLKNKANIISLVITLLFSTLLLPILTIASGAESKQEETATINKVFISNSTPYEFGALAFKEALTEDTYWANTSFEDNTNTATLQVDEVQILAKPSEDGMGYTLQLATSDNHTIAEDCLTSLEDIALKLFDSARYQSLNISEEQLSTLMANWSYKTDSVSDYFADDNQSGTHAMLQLAYSVILMIICTLSVSYIIRSIIEEKASKLVETLMVSVQPLALIVGKVLASMAYAVMMLFSMLGGYVLSYYVTGLFLEVDSMGNMLASAGISSEQLQFSPLAIIAFIISLLLGYLTFSLIAGLSASGCSSLEESDGATYGSLGLLMFGYMFSCGAAAFTAPTMIYISCLVPFLSIFCAPVHYLMGNIGFGTLVLSWLLQLIIIVALAILCGKIYRSLIMHRGSRITWKQMLVMFRQNTASQE